MQLFVVANRGGLEAKPPQSWLQEERTRRDRSTLCLSVFFLKRRLLPTTETSTLGNVDLWPNLTVPLFFQICFWNKSSIFLSSLVVIVIKTWEKAVTGNYTDLIVLSVTVWELNWNKQKKAHLNEMSSRNSINGQWNKWYKRIFPLSEGEPGSGSLI